MRKRTVLAKFFKDLFFYDTEWLSRIVQSRYMGFGFLGGVFLGVASFVWLLTPSVPQEGFVRPAPEEPVGPTAEQVSSVEREKELMSRFLSGLPDMERALENWFSLHAEETDHSIWFLCREERPLEPSVERLLGCAAQDLDKEYPKCLGNVYSIYDIQCDYQGCSWTLCRHTPQPFVCAYSLHGYRPGNGRWDRQCNVLMPQSKDFCAYLSREKGFDIYE